LTQKYSTMNTGNPFISGSEVKGQGHESQALPAWVLLHCCEYRFLLVDRLLLTQGWLLHRSQQESDILLGLFDRIYSDLVVFSVQNLTKKMTTLQCNEIVQVSRSIGSLSTRR